MQYSGRACRCTVPLWLSARRGARSSSRRPCLLEAVSGRSPFAFRDGIVRGWNGLVASLYGRILVTSRDARSPIIYGTPANRCRVFEASSPAQPPHLTYSTERLSNRQPDRDARRSRPERRANILADRRRGRKAGRGSVLCKGGEGGGRRRVTRGGHAQRTRGEKDQSRAAIRV